MALRILPGLLRVPGLLLIATLGVGCSAYSVPGLGFRGVESLLPGTDSIETPLSGGAPVQPLPYSPATARPAPSPPPAPLTVAMLRAGSHYERGLQAMRNGETDRAEWEFDAALETLLDTSLNGPTPGGLLGRNRSSGDPPIGWFGQPGRTLRDPANPETPPDPNEPTLDAPALLDAEDLPSLTGKGDGALPEPDVEKYEFPIVWNEQVRSFIHYFQTRKSGVIARAFERARRYLPMMRRVLREKGLPEELVNLAFIESAVNPWATSKAKAAGIWQFIDSTAKLYGMRVTWWVDERRDPDKATRGAAAYLANLYRMFDSWPLALAAYNAGEGAVQRALDRQRSRDYWKLRLPKETQLFVPAFMAMTIISKEPERYGFSPPADEPFEADTVVLDRPADFRVLARAARTSVERLRELNPELVRWATPPEASRYPLRIPAGMRADFLDELSEIPPAERVSWIAHRVRKGETVAVIAKRYGASIKAVMEMNGLTRRQTPAPGASLFVPAPAAAAVPALAKAEAQGRPESRAKTKAAARHVVKKGESLAQIAKTHGVSPEELRRWNGLPAKAGAKPGQTLALSGPAADASRAPSRLPVSASAVAPTPAQRYTVKRGDTLWDIARAHRVSAENLRRWNRLSPQVGLKPGQALHVSDPDS
jgi:membrane-bound lytic murein transglycosylase D